MPEKSKIDWTNFEKIIVGILTILVVCAGLYRFVITGEMNNNITELTLILVSALVARKGLSYWKPDRYEEQRDSKIIRRETEDKK